MSPSRFIPELRDEQLENFTMTFNYPSPGSGEEIMPPSPPISAVGAPKPRFNLWNFLKYQPQLRAGSPGSRARPPAPRINYPSHSEHHGINTDKLGQVLNRVMTDFRKRVKSMNYIRLKQPASMPHEASQIEYLETQVLGAAVLAVSRMEPDDCNYNIRICRNDPILGGNNDHTFTVRLGENSRRLAVVVLKSGDVVERMLSVIKSITQGVIIDPTDDWKAVTHELRTFAIDGRVRDVLVMDEHVGIYFEFPADPSQADQYHQHFYASTEHAPKTGPDPQLSLRELVAFTVLCALDRADVELRDFIADIAAPTTEGPNRRMYPRIHLGLLPSEPLVQAPRTRRRRVIRNKSVQIMDVPVIDNTPKAQLVSFAVGTDINLEFLEKGDRAHTAVSGTHARDSSDDQAILKVTNTSHQNQNYQPSAVALRIDKIIQDNVARVTDGVNHFIVKCFTDPDNYRWLNNEIAAFNALESLQGTHLPYLLGVARIEGAPSTLALLTEYIGDGTTVQNLVDAAHNIDDLAELHNACARMTRLKESAKRAVQSMHHFRVVHSDVSGKNMLIDDGDHVVMVDFGFAVTTRQDLSSFVRARIYDLAYVDGSFGQWLR